MRNVKRLHIGVGLLGLLLVLSYSPVQSSAGLVWYDTFDELNGTYWDCIASQIINGALRPVPGPPNTQLDRAAMRAYRESNLTVGTWKFDLLETAEWDEELDIVKAYFVSPGRPDYSDYYALSISHATVSGEQCYVYYLEKWFDSHKTNLDDHIGEGFSNTKGVLQHIDITRQSDGLMSVYINSTLILQATDTDITNSSYFGFYTWDDWSFDNLYAYDTIEVGNNTMLILMGAAIAIPIVIIALIWLRKR